MSDSQGVATGVAIEICIDSVEGAIAAEKGGAQRVELCDNLMEGGTTPSAGAIRLARSRTKIGLQVMIRPRGGDFLYSATELDVMRADIETAKELGADGIVLGLLNADGTIDSDRTGELIALARPMNVTFHRAFDMCRDPLEGLDRLIELGVDRVLTSGQEATVIEGMELIRTLRERAGDRIMILPGGGITPRNVRRLVEFTGVKEVHMSARSTVASGMQFRNERCFMGGALRPPEFSRKETDEEIVRAVAQTLCS